MSRSSLSSTTAVASNSSPALKVGVSISSGEWRRAGHREPVATVRDSSKFRAHAGRARHCCESNRVTWTRPAPFSGPRCSFREAPLLWRSRRSRSAYFCALAFSSGSGGGVPSPYAARASASSFSSVASSSVSTLFLRIVAALLRSGVDLGESRRRRRPRRRGGRAGNVEIRCVSRAGRALVHAAFDQRRLGRTAGVACAIGKGCLRRRSDARRARTSSRCRRGAQAAGGTSTGSSAQCSKNHGRAAGLPRASGAWPRLRRCNTCRTRPDASSCGSA